MAMSDFKVSNGVTLFTQQATAINSLWTLFVAATFAAASYGLSSNELSPVAAGAVTIGFIGFAWGNWILLRQALNINLALKEDLPAALQKESPAELTHPRPKLPFEETISRLTATANPIGASRAFHLTIDACTIVALWSHVKLNWLSLLPHGLVGY
jgi:hypothetical protein